MTHDASSPDLSAQNDTIVEVAGNPTPPGAKIIWFDGQDGRKLRACRIPATADTPRGTVIVCPGRTEFIEKYFEVAHELLDRGFAVLIIDWPGQGRSERLLDDPLKGHIDRFETFMTALANGLEVAGEDLPRPYVSLAHSMGGAISLATIMEGIIDVKAAAFCAPMWGLKGKFWGMKYLVWAMNVTGRGGRFAMATGPEETFADNVVTYSEKHWQMNRDLIDNAPELNLGPITWGWLNASLDILKRFAVSKKIEALNIPVFLASASDEVLVDNTSHLNIAKRLPDCEHITINNARHEILMEKDDKRAEFWAGFDRLLDRAGI